MRNVGTPANSEHIVQLHYDLDSDPSPQPISTEANARSSPTANGSRPSKRKVEETSSETHASSKSPFHTATVQNPPVSAGRRRSSRKPAPSKRVKIEDTGSIDSPLTSISPPPPSKPLRSRPGRVPTPAPANSEKSHSIQNDHTTGLDNNTQGPNTTILPPTLPTSVPSSPTKLISLTPSKSESSGTSTSLKIRLPGRGSVLSSASTTKPNTETGNGAKTRKAKR